MGVAGSAERAMRCEWPTVVVAVAVYAAWLLLTAAYDRLPPWVVAVLGGYLVALHGSLQHETVHGHPFARPWANEALVYPSLWLWMPYRAYRDSHRAHHRSAALTDPLDDPESYYLSAARWGSLPAPARAVLNLHATLAGRLVLGPVLAVGGFLGGEARRLAAGDRRARRAWVHHALGSGLVLAWVVGVCAIPISEYLLLLAYPGLAITLLRSFAEHRADPDPVARTAIVEAGPVMALLYLNNNLHAVHHREPGLAWYRLPGRWRELAGRAPLHGDRFAGYPEIVRRYLVTPFQPPVHPGLGSPTGPDPAPHR